MILNGRDVLDGLAIISKVVGVQELRLKVEDSNPLFEDNDQLVFGSGPNTSVGKSSPPLAGSEPASAMGSQPTSFMSRLVLPSVIPTDHEWRWRSRRTPPFRERLAAVLNPILFTVTRSGKRISSTEARTSVRQIVSLSLVFCQSGFVTSLTIRFDFFFGGFRRLDWLDGWSNGVEIPGRALASAECGWDGFGLRSGRWRRFEGSGGESDERGSRRPSETFEIEWALASVSSWSRGSRDRSGACLLLLLSRLARAV